MVENVFGILGERLRVLLTTMEQKPEVVRDIVLTCVVLPNMLRSPGTDRPSTPADDRQPQQADQVALGPDENFRKNPSREDKHQRDLLKDYFNLEALAGLKDRINEDWEEH